MGKDINAPMPIAAFFHSFSQVVLVQNVISGVLIIGAFFAMAFFHQDAALRNPHVAILPIIAAIVGNVTAKILGNDDQAISDGLFGFCPVLVGAAAAVFYTYDGAPIDGYVVAIVGSILVVPLQMIIGNLCGRLGIPGFTMPFIAMTWFMLLVSTGSGLLTGCGWTASAPIAGALADGAAAPAAFAFSEINWVNVLTLGYCEVYILDTVIGGILILLAFAVDSWKNAIKLIFVTLFVVAMVFLFQGSVSTLNAGVFTYNAILVLMGMEVFSKNKDNPGRYWTLVILGLISVVLVDMALPAIVGTFGLSNLTFPFVLVTWGLLLLEQQLPEKFMAK